MPQGDPQAADRLLLRAVVCPLTPRELPAALSNLAFWADGMLSPMEDASERPRLVFSFSSAADPALSDPLAAAFDANPDLRGAFAALETRFCDLPPEKNVYARATRKLHSPYGNLAGPNWLFYETLSGFRGEPGFVFLMETDCTPIAPDWLARLERTCQRHAAAWIVGANYCGASRIPVALQRHLNGNALYHVGDSGFWQFLTGILWPWMQEHVRTSDPNLAVDCAWEAFIHRPEMQDAEHPDWILVRRLLHRFVSTDVIVNIGGKAERSGQRVWTKQEILDLFPRAAIVHGPL